MNYFFANPPQPPVANMYQTILIYTGGCHSDEEIKVNIIKYWENPYQFQAQAQVKKD